MGQTAKVRAVRKVVRGLKKKAQAKQEYEYLLVAEGATLAETCAYLRDIDVPIVETIQRADGRWVVKVLAATETAA